MQLAHRNAHCRLLRRAQRNRTIYTNVHGPVVQLLAIRSDVWVVHNDRGPCFLPQLGPRFQKALQSLPLLLLVTYIVGKVPPALHDM